MSKALRVGRTAWLQVIRADAVREQGGKCMYCRCRITTKTATADHKKPRLRSGLNTRENIVAACYACNQAKGSLSVGAFFNLIKRKYPSGASVEIKMVWATRRIWTRANRACDRIEQRFAPHHDQHLQTGELQ